MIGSYFRRDLLTPSRIRELSTLVLGESHSGRVDVATTSSIVRAAKAIGPDVTVLISGQDIDVHEMANQVAGTLAVKVLVAKHEALARHLAEPMAVLLTELARNSNFSFTHILAPGTTFGKNILPRSAAQLGVQPLSDIIRVVNKDTFVRPIYAGNALQTVQYVSPVGHRIMTVRPSAFPPELSSPSNSSVPSAVHVLSEVDLQPLLKYGRSANAPSRFECEESARSERPELGSAKVVVCGGRALKTADNFKSLLGSLADALGGAVGASRAAVDAGFVPNDLQVGQTGKVVAPDLYIGIGISGAIQHLAGMKDSKTIVAINTDPEAPIFQVADYGLVQDLFVAVPELERQLRSLKPQEHN